jgi:uncharacterized protein (TIGR02996 family)
MDDEEAFQAALDANPDDHTTRLVFADWLQERDDPRAAGYREMGRIGFSPLRQPGAFLGGNHVREITGADDVIWEAWNGNALAVARGMMAVTRDSGAFRGHTLPGLWLLFVECEAYERDGVVWNKGFSSRRECDDAVALAYPHYVAYLAPLPLTTPASDPAPG